MNRIKYLYWMYLRWKFFSKLNKQLKPLGFKATLFESNGCLNDIIQISKGKDFTHLSASHISYSSNHMIKYIIGEVIHKNEYII